MAPIPQTLDDETKETIDSLRRREKDLEHYQIPRLTDCKGPLSVQQRLAAELREDLDVFGKQVENLEIRAEDVPRKSDRLAILQLVEEFRESSARIRRDMRSALLHSKKTIDAQARSNREQLFSGAAVADSRGVEEKATDDALMKASHDVTDALRRTVGLMQSELERSVLSHQILEQSTATLSRTSIQHDILSSATHASKQLITALEHSDWLDRLLILAALSFFLLVVLFIVKQRVLDRGIRLAFWWTRFLPIRAGKDLEKGTVMDGVRATIKEGKLGSATLSSLVRSGTQLAREALETVLGQSSSSASVDSAGTGTIADTSVSLESVTGSDIQSILESFVSSATSVATDTTSTTTVSDVLSETLTAMQHSEL